MNYGGKVYCPRLKLLFDQNLSYKLVRSFAQKANLTTGEPLLGPKVPPFASLISLL